MTTRESRVIKAFENCIEHGEYTVDYAILLIEDNKRYGWLSDEAKNSFYDWLDSYEARNEIEEAGEAFEPAEESQEEQSEEVEE